MNEPATALFCDASHLGVIAVAGADAAAFLQGQLTNNVEALSEQQAQLSAFCSPQGRVLGIFWIYRRGDEYRLITARERVAPLAKRLRLFVLRAAVTVDDANDRLAVVGVAGAGAGALLGGLLAAAVPPLGSVARGGDPELDALAIPAAAPAASSETQDATEGEPTAGFGAVRYLCVLDREQLTALQALVGEKNVDRAGPVDWRRLDIRAGLAYIVDATADSFVPQMLALDQFDAISFHKGCYVGQEVVARAHYLGKVKRRLVRVSGADAADAPLPGETLYDAGRAGAQIVDVVAAADGAGYSGLAVASAVDAEQLSRETGGAVLLGVLEG